MIKAIIFDLGRVIFIGDATSYEGRVELAKEFGLESNFLQKFWFERKNSFITGKMSEEEYLSDLIKESGINMNLSGMKKKIREKNMVDPKMLDLVKELKKKYILCALTNDVKEWVEYRINNFSLNEYFDLIITSADEGCAKPNKQIYLNTLRKLKVSPEEVIFIDDREENLIPANELGMKTFHFKNSEDFLDWLKINKVL